MLGHTLQLNPTWRNKTKGALGQATYCNCPHHLAQGLGKDLRVLRGASRGSASGPDPSSGAGANPGSSPLHKERPDDPGRGRAHRVGTPQHPSPASEVLAPGRSAPG